MLQINRTRENHGLSQRPEYSVWKGIRRRCHDPESAAWPDYGGRGISVCARWRNSFATFLRDMGRRPSRRHTIDRIDNNGDYEPGNCRWTTMNQQNQNSRHCNYITYNGVRKTLTKWARHLGFKRAALSNRIVVRGWSVRRAFTTPMRRR